MKRKPLIVKKTQVCYGIFLRTMQERPLQVFTTKKAAKQRLKQYYKNVKENG